MNTRVGTQRLLVAFLISWVAFWGFLTWNNRVIAESYNPRINQLMDVPALQYTAAKARDVQSMIWERNRYYDASGFALYMTIGGVVSAIYAYFVGWWIWSGFNAPTMKDFEDAQA